MIVGRLEPSGSDPGDTRRDHVRGRLDEANHSGDRGCGLSPSDGNAVIERRGEVETARLPPRRSSSDRWTVQCTRHVQFHASKVSRDCHRRTRRWSRDRGYCGAQPPRDRVITDRFAI